MLLSSINSIVNQGFVDEHRHINPPIKLSSPYHIFISSEDKSMDRSLYHKQDICANNKCIRVGEFWRLRPGFRCILSSNARKGARKVRFCTRNCNRNPCAFWLRLSVRVIPSKKFCLRLTEITRMGLISLLLTGLIFWQKRSPVLFREYRPRLTAEFSTVRNYHPPAYYQSEFTHPPFVLPICLSCYGVLPFCFKYTLARRG